MNKKNIKIIASIVGFVIIMVFILMISIYKSKKPQEKDININTNVNNNEQIEDNQQTGDNQINKDVADNTENDEMNKDEEIENAKDDSFDNKDLENNNLENKEFDAEMTVNYKSNYETYSINIKNEKVVLNPNQITPQIDTSVLGKTEHNFETKNKKGTLIVTVIDNREIDYASMVKVEKGISKSQLETLLKDLMSNVNDDINFTCEILGNINSSNVDSETIKTKAYFNDNPNNFVEFETLIEYEDDSSQDSSKSKKTNNSDIEVSDAINSDKNFPDPFIPELPKVENMKLKVKEFGTETKFKDMPDMTGYYYYGYDYYKKLDNGAFIDYMFYQCLPAKNYIEISLSGKDNNGGLLTYNLELRGDDDVRVMHDWVRPDISESDSDKLYDLTQEIAAAFAIYNNK